MSENAAMERARQFVLNVQRSLREDKLQETHALYEDDFNRLADRMGARPWPARSSLVLDDLEPLVGLLYDELYYRHLYWKVHTLSGRPPTIAQRVAAWDNYCALFDLLLGKTIVGLRLPLQWLYDVLDEFVYQQQSNALYRYNLPPKDDDEITLLTQLPPTTWSVGVVCEYLHKFIRKAQDIKELQAQKETTESLTLYSSLACFACVELCRVHCLMGDYYNALAIVDAHLDLHQKGVHTQVLTCQVTAKYYVGLALLMVRRVADAARTLSSVLVHLGRVRPYHLHSYQHDSMGKKSEHIYALLAISVSLCPQRLDEQVHAALRDKHGDLLARMAKGEESAFAELFNYGCPKFISVAPINYDERKNYSAEAQQQQQRLFMNEVRQQLVVPNLRSFLRLYTTISISKLAEFLDLDESSLRRQLLCYKHKTRGLVWSSGPLLSGKWAQTLDVDFVIEGDMLHLREARPTHNFTDYFVRHIHKLNAVINQ